MTSYFVAQIVQSFKPGDAGLLLGKAKAKEGVRVLLFLEVAGRKQPPLLCRARTARFLTDPREVSLHDIALLCMDSSVFSCNECTYRATGGTSICTPTALHISFGRMAALCFRSRLIYCTFYLLCSCSGWTTAVLYQGFTPKISIVHPHQNESAKLSSKVQLKDKEGFEI